MILGLYMEQLILDNYLLQVIILVCKGHQYTEQGVSRDTHITNFSKHRSINFSSRSNLVAVKSYQVFQKQLAYIIVKQKRTFDQRVYAKCPESPTFTLVFINHNVYNILKLESYSSLACMVIDNWNNQLPIVNSYSQRTNFQLIIQLTVAMTIRLKTSL